GSVCAAQPVTTILACGRFRRSARIACRAWRTASAVTAQVLTTTVSLKPARSASRRITCDSAALSRQPKVTTSTLTGSRFRSCRACIGEQCGIEPAGVLVFDGSGHQHVIVSLAPFDREVAARQSDRHLTAGAAEPCRGDRNGASRRTAGLSEAGAALPGADHRVIA